MTFDFYDPIRGTGRPPGPSEEVHQAAIRNAKEANERAHRAGDIMGDNARLDTPQLYYTIPPIPVEEEIKRNEETRASIEQFHVCMDTLFEAHYNSELGPFTKYVPRGVCHGGEEPIHYKDLSKEQREVVVKDYWESKK